VRSRRRKSSGSADWVYRAGKYEDADPATQEPALSGTYYNPITLGVGPENATAQVLYDSAQYTSSRLAINFDDAIGGPARFVIGGEARPDQNRKGALIHGVEVGIYMHIDATGWTSASSHLFLAARIVVARQDPDTGQALMDPSYEMWGNFTGWQSDEPSVYANGRQNCWETRFFKTRQTADTAVNAFIHRPFVKVRRRLEEHEGLFLYLELHSNSAALTGTSFLNLWCRTLVTDNNR